MTLSVLNYRPSFVFFGLILFLLIMAGTAHEYQIPVDSAKKIQLGKKKVGG